MEFWTILVISYGSGLFANDVSLIPYPSQSACGAAIETLYTSLSPTFPDLTLQCRETSEPSSSIRPQPRPSNLGAAE